MPAPANDEATAILDTLADLSTRFDPHPLRRFITEVLSWNPHLGLVSRRNTPTVIENLIRQSVDFWDFVAATSGGAHRVADIGSGAGFPGVIWKLLVPGLQVVLIERKRRRAVFLEGLLRRLDRSGIEVVESDVRDLTALGRGAFDLAVMLAVAPPAEMAHDVEVLLSDGGHFGSLRRGAGRTPETRLGRSLLLTNSRETTDGTFVLYQKNPVLP